MSQRPVEKLARWLASAVSAWLVQACSVDDRAVQDPVSFTSSGGNAGVPGNGGAAGIENGSSGAENGSSGAENGSASCSGLSVQSGEVGFFISLDSSASMLEMLPLQGTTKWSAVQASLATFAQAASAQGTHLGIGFFPQMQPGVPDVCTTNEDCGLLAGPCSNSVCVVDDAVAVEGQPPSPFVRAAGDPATPCHTVADCSGAGETCRAMLGECILPPGVSAGAPEGAFLNLSSDPARVVSPLCETQADCAGIAGSTCEAVSLCENRLLPCTSSLACPAGAGTCVALPHSCRNAVRCDSLAYSTPRVPMGPNTGDAIVSALQSQVPIGPTPSGPALAGAYEHARRWIYEGSLRRAVVILATDGFPTECTPLALPDIVAAVNAASTGLDSIRTFVIGVFTDADLGGDGRARLNSLAAAGNTQAAFVINTSGNVDAEFSQALGEIRTQLERCEVPLEPSAAAEPEQLDLFAVDLAGAERQLQRVSSAEQCTAGDSEWHLSPTGIRLCPDTCTRLGSSSRLELRAGCAD